jgi:hypothetical protein
MPIKFICLSDSYCEKIKSYGYEAFNMRIEDYIPDDKKRTYYISPSNSLCFMDGGIDYSLSRKIFPNIEKKVKEIVRKIGITNLLGRNYLPIGSSIILDQDNISLVVSPTMLLPQNVSKTLNAYFCTMAVMYNILINRKEKLENIDIIFTSLCCGFGKMDESDSINQILLAFDNYKNYNPKIINDFIIINEPNLNHQPKYYQNSEWFAINPNQIEHI